MLRALKKCAVKTKELMTRTMLLALARKQITECCLPKLCVKDVRQLRSTYPVEYEKLTEALWKRKCKELKCCSRKIRVAFVVAHVSMWSCDELYELFSCDSRFAPYIVLAHASSNKGGADKEAFRSSEAWMKEHHFSYHTLSLETPKRDCFEKMGSPDIVFYLTPYANLLPVGCNIYYLPADTLTVYIPYSYMLSDAPGKYTSPGMVDTWRHFADSEYYAKKLIDHDPLNRRNTRFVGYPKMDIYYAPPQTSGELLWKISPNADPAKVKRIIYAPHHSLEGSKICSQFFSTFADNYLEILRYAQNNPETTSWIVKPHPVLRTTVLETGLYASSEEYDAYLDSWRSLPNATVVEESTYYDIFKTSDAMILDSVSFIAEYQFTGKPLLFLTKEGQKFNEFGGEILKKLYRADGKDIVGIGDFIQNVVICGNDVMGRERVAFFSENLSYRTENGPSASGQIFDQIIQEIMQE